MQNEAAIEGRCARLAEKRGWLVRKLSYPGRRGAPDRMFVRAGRVWFVEFKDPMGEVSALQKYEIGNLRKAGADVSVISSEADFLAGLKKRTV